MSLKDITKKKKELSEKINSGTATISDIENYHEWNYDYYVISTLGYYANMAKKLTDNDEKKKHRRSVFRFCVDVLSDKNIGKDSEKKTAGKSAVKNYVDEQIDRFKEFDFENDDYSKEISSFLKVYADIFQAWRFAYIK